MPVHAYSFFSCMVKSFMTDMHIRYGSIGYLLNWIHAGALRDFLFFLFICIAVVISGGRVDRLTISLLSGSRGFVWVSFALSDRGNAFAIWFVGSEWRRDNFSITCGVTCKR